MKAVPALHVYLAGLDLPVRGRCRINLMEQMTIGQVSHKSGLSVKTIRFYSDEGLVPPSDRSDAGYRLYTQGDLARLELVRTLREAGLDLSTIASVLEKRLSLADALSARLHAVEAHIASLQKVAAALRAAVGSKGNDDDLRRLNAVTKLSNDERREVIERFYAKVSEGTNIDPDWTEQMIAASAPEMPDDPSPAQLDAWVELSEIVGDAQFLESMKQSASQTWSEDYDLATGQAASQKAVEAARGFMKEGIAPSNDAVSATVHEFLAGSAAASKREVDDSFKAEMRESFISHDPRAMRYWELVAVINGAPEIQSSVDEWAWLSKAVVHHLSQD